MEKAQNTFSWNRAILFFASPLFVLIIWEVAARTGIIDSRFFPEPTAIAAELVRLLLHDTLLTDIGASLSRIGIGLIIGFIPGVILGLAMGLKSWVRAALAPLIALTYPIPKIAILPLLLIIFGLGEMSNIMVVAIGVFFIALINTYAGVQQIPAVFYDVAKVYNISRWARLTKIIIPATFPDIFTALRLAVGYGLILIVAAEMVAADSGLGHRIWMSWETYVIKELYASLAVISLIGVFFALVLEKAEVKLIHWKKS